VAVNTAKQGMFAPCSGPYCYSLEEIPLGVEKVIVANPNYDEISDNTKYI